LDDLVIFDLESDYQKYQHLFDLAFKSIILEKNQPIKLKKRININQPILIPKILHFVWLSKGGNPDIPLKHNFNINLFRQHNPEFKIKKWNNEKFLKLLSELYPNRYQQFINIPVHIMKCDIARMIILQKYGGFYFDLDFYCKQSLSTLAQQRKIILTEEIPEHCSKNKQLYNGALACCPNDPFIIGWIEQMFKNIERLSIPMTINVMGNTGPIGFWNYYFNYPNKPELISPKYLIPYSSKHRLSSVVDNPDDIYTYTIWSEGSGWATTNNDAVIIFIAIVWIIFFFALMIILLIKSINKLKNKSNNSL
jgi:mannosyltransferase OCH1-like enzyme